MKIYDYKGRKNISGNRIREARLKKRLSQADFAARLQIAGITMERDSISRIEIGTRFVADYEKKTKKTLLVLTERKSRREIIRPMRDQTARSVVRVLDSLEREYGANFNKIFRTITVDNGSEFADCAGMEKSCRRKGNRTKIYYCHPYSSYERGSNENVNRMIRRWFPKGTDFRKVTAKAIQKVEDWINNYPREILGFRTAEAVFQEGVACLT